MKPGNPLAGADRAQPQTNVRRQLDGTPINQRPAPTKAPLAPRYASPANYNTSGIERAMGEHADKVHRRR